MLLGPRSTNFPLQADRDLQFLAETLLKRTIPSATPVLVAPSNDLSFSTNPPCRPRSVPPALPMAIPLLSRFGIVVCQNDQPRTISPEDGSFCPFPSPSFSSSTATGSGGGGGNGAASDGDGDVCFFCSTAAGRGDGSDGGGGGGYGGFCRLSATSSSSCLICSTSLISDPWSSSFRASSTWITCYLFISSCSVLRPPSVNITSRASYSSCSLVVWFGMAADFSPGASSSMEIWLS